MKKLLLLITCLFSMFYVSSQEFAMADARFVTCTGDFTDSGGLAGNYQSGEDLTMTICSPFVTDQMQATFTLWDVAVGDLLLVYDGDTATGSPIGVFTSALVPNIVISTAANTTGCLTFRFISGANSTGKPGWQATLACIDSCQTIANQVTTTPAPDADDIIRVCQGDTVSFSGATNFSVDGTGATHEYILSDGTIVSGTTASETYTDPGIYKVDYVTFDVNGCRDRVLEDATIIVSTTPDFTGTEATDSTICFGESTTITGLVETTQYFADVAPPVTGQTFLPDGPDDPEYETCIDVQGFPNGATFQNSSDLVNIFINMEHSFMGDLSIVLTAPDGSQVEILNFPNSGGGIFFGDALDDGTNNPGIGFDYVITESAAATLDGSTGGVTGGTPMPAGDYLPETPFSNLVGTPLNGLWCLTIVDNLAIDNGFIFYWGLNFNPAIVPDAGSYQPLEVVEEWDTTNPDIIDINGNDITVSPATAGQHCYDFTLTDDFGCSYTETVCIEVLPELITVTPTDLIVCQESGAVDVDLTSKDDEIRDGLSPTDFDVAYFNSSADADADTNAISTPDAFMVSSDVTVWARVFDVVNGCYSLEPVNVVYQSVQFNAVNDLELCDDLSADQVEEFDLTNQIDQILGSQTLTDVDIAFYTTQQDADDDTNPITAPEAYNNTSNPQTIFVRVSTAQDQDCYEMGQFNLVVLEQPSIGSVDDVSDCATNAAAGLLDLTLSDFDQQVLDGQNASGFTVSYFNDETDAIDNTNVLPASYGATDQETIYARITDNTTGCFNYVAFNVTVEVCELFIPEGFSPNGDSTNETFALPNLEQFPNFELKIFNRNGNVVYETSASNYVEFAGIANTGIMAGDGLLPVGTYFYVLKFNSPDHEDIASWLYINY